MQQGVPLWDALGWPPIDAIVPPARSASWGRRRDWLADCLASLGAGRRRLTPGRLWLLAHSTPPPRCFCWRQLCHGKSTADIATAIVQGSSASVLAFLVMEREVVGLSHLG